MERKTLFAKKKIKREKGAKLRELSTLGKEKIYQQHLGLVVSIAKRYIGKSPDFTFEDLIQEGILGLFKAAEKFDEQKGFRFSTYATCWIKQFINRALNERGRTIRIYGCVIELSNKYTKVKEKLWRELEQEPSVEEMAEAMKITIDKARRIKKFLENPSKFFSLERPSKEDGDSAFSELIEDTRITSPVELASENILKEDLGETLKRLTHQEEKIIKMRFGLEDGKNRTLREIAKEIGSNRETIRLIINKALARLRENEESRLKKEL